MSFFFRAKPSASMAKERLRMVLIQDRSLLSPGMLDNMRKDMIEVLNKYFVVDNEGIEIDIDSKDTSTMLVANIPIIQTKRRTNQ